MVPKITSSSNNTNISESLLNVKINNVTELKDLHSSGEKNWILTDIADHTQLGSPKRLDDKRRMMESFGTCSDGSVDDRMRRLQQQLQDRAQESDRRVGQLQRELAVVSQSLQEKTREVQLARQQQRECEQHLQERTRQVTSAREQLRESEQHLQERTREVTSAREQLRECERRLTASTSHWIVRSEEVEMTGPELGRGGWAIVSVATFRGVRVAAKMIHRLIISHHNLQLFRREMNMAARLRHPNLVQFIGATMEGNMVILTELMPTSLRAQLQQDIYMPPKVVMSVSLDVARALNYLHQIQPDPIIHRDISSANVLLEPLRDGQWRAKLSDYGTVNLFHQLETVNPGSPVYAAPEANDPRLQSTKMDIYSFGALMLEMLTGQLPTPEDRPALLLRVHHDQLLDLIRRCLSERAQDRPDAATFIRELTN